MFKNRSTFAEVMTKNQMGCNMRMDTIAFKFPTIAALPLILLNRTLTARSK